VDNKRERYEKCSVLIDVITKRKILTREQSVAESAAYDDDINT
jgi:hypothetical protein